MQVAWFQLLVSATEISPADFQLFEAHCLDKRKSVSCFGGSRATGPVLELFRKSGALGSSTRKPYTYKRDYT